jgi:23S rRNA (uridine2552-2'-O)-methyltransferase
MSRKKRSPSSRNWLNSHFSDTYVIKAKEASVRSRAWFKLDEIQKKERIIKPGTAIIDLGSSPGSWCQYIRSCIRGNGHIFANDILSMQPISNVNFLKGNLNDEEFFKAFISRIDQKKIHLVTSDMAPNLTGISTIDASRSISLFRLALKVCQHALSCGGNFLVKTFQGESFGSCLSEIRCLFEEVKVRKPSASRSSSNEIYLVAKGWKA